MTDWQRLELEEALATALRHDDSVCVVTDADDDAAYVQLESARFVDSADDDAATAPIGLVLDFPIHDGLTPEQVSRAEAWFRGQGVKAPSERECVFAGAGGRERRGFAVTWNATAGRTAGQAAGRALDLMRCVFGEPRSIECDTWRDAPK